MEFDIIIGSEDWNNRCIVCDKAVDHGGGFCRLEIEDGKKVALCCPLCLEAFKKNEDLRRSQARAAGDQQFHEAAEVESIRRNAQSFRADA